jgi:hypothetical protein
VSSSNPPELPPWLEVLLAVSCFVRRAFPLQAAAAATLLEMVSLTQEVVETRGARGQEQRAERRLRSASHGTVAVLILPSLSPKLLNYINEHTGYYKVSDTCTQATHLAQ